MRATTLALGFGLTPSTVLGAPAPPQPVVTLILKGHRFSPDAPVVTAGRRFRLEIVNADPTTEESESAALNIEREIAPHGKLVL